MARAVTIVASGGLPVTNIDTAGALGVPLTPVSSGGVPITLVSSGGMPAVLVNETGSLFYGLSGIEPLHYWDFTTNRALFNRQDVGGVASTPGWSFTRASDGTYYNADGTVSTFNSGTLRIGSRGLLIEEGRTNLFLNSAIGGTQTVTLLTGNFYALNFRGTGTITLSGAFVGSLVGTGANNIVSLVFLTTTTSLTLTVTGSCTEVMLEFGLGPSSWIPTTGASASRNSEVLTVSSPGVDFPLTLFLEYERAFDSGAPVTLFRVDDGTINERAVLGINGSDVARAIAVDGGATQGDVTLGTLVINTIYKQAGAFATNRVQNCLNGTLGTEDTVATMPATPSIIRFGAGETGITQPFAYLRRAAIFNTALTDAQLQAITS
jgi:hypothetical protein